MALQEKRKAADLKVIIMGAAGVGKTSFIHRYIEGHFKESVTTLGASFLLKQWKNHNVAIWDTAGEERFHGLTQFYSRNAGAAILAFDLTSEDSFHALRAVFVPLLQSALENCVNVVVGTKLDLVPSRGRAVEPADAQRLASELNANTRLQPYFETSSLSGDNVNEVFEFIFQKCFANDSGVDKSSGSTIRLENSSQPVQSSCRC